MGGEAAAIKGRKPLCEAKRSYLEYNLQFFAKDGPGGEKTEEPTGKKLEDARKKGQVAKSRELVSAVSLLLSFVLIKMILTLLNAEFQQTFRDVYNHIPEVGQTAAGSSGVDVFMNQMFGYVLKRTLIILAPFLAVTFGVAFIMNIVQFKWKISGEPLKPKFNKFNPVSGMKKLFSKDSLMELFKSILKIGLIVWIIWGDVEEVINTILPLYGFHLLAGLGIIGNFVLNIAIKIAAFYLIIGLLDFIYQKRKFKNEMKMTKQEVKDEYKNTEGNPEIKGKIRSKMREVSQRRMMQSVPSADVVITNPTHLAVALKYESNLGRAPVVVAKGEDFLAKKIREMAKEHQVEIVENKPLARMLYYNVEIGQEIPPELYQAVAEVLAFVYNLKQGA